MAKLNWGPRTLGSLLRPEVQREALARFVHRYTKEHVPDWAKWSVNAGCKVQFASDAEWLSNTVFRTNKDGTLNDRVKYCESRPTWPDNPELRPGFLTANAEADIDRAERS